MARFEQHRILSQILLWSGTWLLVSYFLTNGFDNPERFTTRNVPILIGMALVILVNNRVLLPRLYFRKRQVAFVIAGIVLLAIITFLLYSEIFPWTEWYRQRPRGPLASIRKGNRINDMRSGIRWMGRLTPFIIAFLGSTLVEIARFANKKEKEAIRSENEKLETELKFLKSQVNPHFLFNALNNIYSLAVTQAPQTPESVMQLSEILRYMVYDSNEELVPLQSEINYIENFIQLKLLKDSRGMDVQLDLDQQVNGAMVAPLLFIPFVENAFKHSKIEDLKGGYIRVGLRAGEGEVHFSVVNSLPQNNFTKDKVGGVGLENIKKRLELLYPGNRHDLQINRMDDRFQVLLKLAL